MPAVNSGEGKQLEQDPRPATDVSHQNGEGESKALRAVAGLFASKGFHGVTMGDLEDAAGLPREALIEVFRDKERLFYAAIESRLQERSAGEGGEEEQEPLLRLLPRLQQANSNAKLRSIHKEAFARLQSLLDEKDGLGRGSATSDGQAHRAGIDTRLV